MKTFILLAMWVFPGLCVADVFKCVDAKGNISLSDVPCSNSIAERETAGKPPVKSSTRIRGVAPSTQDQRNARSAYMAYHAAVVKQDWRAYLSALSAQQRMKMERFGERSLVAVAAAQPEEVAIVEDAVNGDIAILKVKGKSPSMVAGSSAESYGTIHLQRDGAGWKLDKQLWSNSEWGSAPEGAELQAVNKDNCRNTAGVPLSLPNDPILQMKPNEIEIARGSLESGHRNEISFSAQGRQAVTVRVAHNEALRCQYAEAPVAMSVDGGKTWFPTYAGGYSLSPAMGKIKVMLKNTGRETLNLLLVARDE